MQEGDQDNLQTWPRAQLPAKLVGYGKIATLERELALASFPLFLPRVRMEMSQWIQRENELQQAKAFLATQKQAGKSEFGPLIERMCELIEQANQMAASKALMATGDGRLGKEKVAQP